MTGDSRAPLAEIVAIGDELVHGSQLDTNSRWLAEQLERRGVTVARFSVVGDEPVRLRALLAEACGRADVILTTGGLGPTLDDRTREVFAELVGGELWFDASSWPHIVDMLAARGRQAPDSNRRQAMFPFGAEVLANASGTAPGFRLQVQQAAVFCLPGVPREMTEMAERYVFGFVESLRGLQPIVQHVMRVVGPSEADLGERIAEFMRPDHEPTVGITASSGLLTIRIVAQAATREAATSRCLECAASLRTRLGSWLVAEGDATLEELVVARLRERAWTLAMAESCTGGLGAGRLVGVPGASEVLKGGVVAYTNEVKVGMLGVSERTLAAHGAVSEQTVREMARGAVERLGADIGIGISGIAGPGGGSADKPVGTVCLGYQGPAGERAWTVRIPDFGRQFIRDRALLEVWIALLRELT
jgi:nicotinamide-nucleotide amidase